MCFPSFLKNTLNPRFKLFFMISQKHNKVRGNTREKGENPEKCVRGFPVLHSEADPGGTSRKTLFLERELGNGRQGAGLRLSRLGWAPRSGWLTGQRVFRLGQAGKMAN